MAAEIQHVLIICLHVNLKACVACNLKSEEPLMIAGSYAHCKSGNILEIAPWWGHGQVMLPNTHYKILGAPIISPEQLSLKSSDFVHELSYINSSNAMTYHQQNGVVMVT